MKYFIICCFLFISFRAYSQTKKESFSPSNDTLKSIFDTRFQSELRNKLLHIPYDKLTQFKLSDTVDNVIYNLKFDGDKIVGSMKIIEPCENCATTKFHMIAVDLCIMYCVKLKGTQKEICTTDKGEYLEKVKDKRYDDLGGGPCL